MPRTTRKLCGPCVGTLVRCAERGERAGKRSFFGGVIVRLFPTFSPCNYSITTRPNLIHTRTPDCPTDLPTSPTPCLPPLPTPPLSHFQPKRPIRTVHFSKSDHFTLCSSRILKNDNHAQLAHHAPGTPTPPPEKATARHEEGTHPGRRAPFPSPGEGRRTRPLLAGNPPGVACRPRYPAAVSSMVRLDLSATCGHTVVFPVGRAVAHGADTMAASQPQRNPASRLRRLRLPDEERSEEEEACRGRPAGCSAVQRVSPARASEVAGLKWPDFETCLVRFVIEDRR